MSLITPDESDLAALAAMVGAKGVVAEDAVAPYLAEPRDLAHGRAAMVLRPVSTAEVSQIVRHCAVRRIGIVPYGGGTGLVGGQVAPDGPLPVVVALDRMARIRAVSVEESAITVEAGVILADVQAAAEAANMLFPLSLAAEGSCRIGGNLATNAGGVQVLRYGNARDLCLGIEAVLPSGAVLEGLKTLRKDNTGYDLRHLMIGAEGTLGIITAATLRLFPRPAETATAMLAVESPAAAVALLAAMRAALGDSIAAFELIHGTGVGFVRRFHPEIADPLPWTPAWRVLAEVAGPGDSRLAERVETALAGAFETGHARDGVMAASEGQRRAMWRLREAIPEANRRVGAVASHDVSLPIGRIATFVAEGAEVVAGFDATLVTNCFGHLGDGNLHYNVFPPEGRQASDFADRRGAIRRAIHDLVHAHGGSVSAEHGIGRFKTADLVRYSDPAKLAAMRAIKTALDPAGIMNPGAVLAEPIAS